MALAALAKHQLRLGMQTANTQRNKLTKHTYQSHMFSVACPMSLEKLLAVALLIMHLRIGFEGNYCGEKTQRRNAGEKVLQDEMHIDG